MAFQVGGMNHTPTSTCTLLGRPFFNNLKKKRTLGVSVEMLKQIDLFGAISLMLLRE